MSKGVLYAIILTLVFFIVLPFPLNFIACAIAGAIIPWVTDDKNNKKDIDR